MKLAALTYEQVAELERPVAIVPVGSVEPHGPHLPLDTDTLISETCAARAATELAKDGIVAVVAPSVPYGVTDYAAGFAGAIGVPADVLTSMLRAIAEKLLANGFVHVCFVNNHLEPAHDAAVRAGDYGFARVGRVPAHAPLGPHALRRVQTRRLPRGSLRDLARHGGGPPDGRHRTTDLGPQPRGRDQGGQEDLRRNRDGPRIHGRAIGATTAEGDDLYTRLVTMVVTEIKEALTANSANTD